MLIKNAKVLIDGKFDFVNLLIQNGKIAKITKDDIDCEDVIDASGLTLLPAFVDIHAHFREPGYEYKEDIASGSAAAVKGGYASVCVMPNTNPIMDNETVVNYVINRAKEVGLCKVYPIASITKGSKGSELSEIGILKNAGAVAISDDGLPVENALIMKNAMQYANGFGIKVISHCEDKSLVDGGVVNEGFNSTIAGLRGITRASEELMVYREVLLAKTYDLPVHIAHISTINSVEIIRNAKASGVKVTAETCPHYYSADDSYILDYNADAKVNPPLRTEEDKEAIIQGLIDGTIDAIATDHAPHNENDKNIEFGFAANGISGLETAFSLSYTHLVKSGRLTLAQLSNLMSNSPASVLNLGNKTICENAIADIVLIDENTEYIIDKNNFASKGKNTPFHGEKVFGKVVCTIVDGKVKYKCD